MPIKNPSTSVNLASRYMTRRLQTYEDKDENQDVAKATEGRDNVY